MLSLRVARSLRRIQQQGTQSLHSQQSQLGACAKALATCAAGDLSSTLTAARADAQSVLLCRRRAPLSADGGPTRVAKASHDQDGVIGNRWVEGRSGLNRMAESAREL